MNFEQTRSANIGWIGAGEFAYAPNIRLSFGPISFGLHDLDAHNWCAVFHQRKNARELFRGHLRIFPANNRRDGFSIKLPRIEFKNWSDVFAALASIEGGIRFNAKQEIAMRQEVEIRQMTIEQALADHNAATLAALGDWRPEPRQPDSMDNVIMFKRIIAEIKEEAA